MKCVVPPKAGDAAKRRMQTGTILVVTPVLILYLWAQRYIVEGIAAGAVKG